MQLQQAKDPAPQMNEINEALEMGNKIEQEYDDYQLLIQALRQDESGSNKSKYSQEQLDKVQEAASDLEKKILTMIMHRKKMARLLGQALPDSKRLTDIEKSVLESMEQLKSIAPFRSDTPS